MRRGFGRPLRRMLGPDVPPLLQHANQMLSAGNYAEAANAFEQLARAAEARGGPRAALFYLQAGRSRILAGQTANGMEYLERGLGLFTLRGQAGRAEQAAQRVIGELKARGLRNEAQNIADYIKQLLPEFGMERTVAGVSPLPKRTLPTHCPGCGAPLRPDEVEWADQSTAVCGYCGSPVHGA